MTNQSNKTNQLINIPHRLGQSLFWGHLPKFEIKNICHHIDVVKKFKLKSNFRSSKQTKFCWMYLFSFLETINDHTLFIFFNLLHLLMMGFYVNTNVSTQRTKNSY